MTKNDNATNRMTLTDTPDRHFSRDSQRTATVEATPHLESQDAFDQHLYPDDHLGHDDHVIEDHHIIFQALRTQEPRIERSAQIIGSHGWAVKCKERYGQENNTNLYQLNSIPHQVIHYRDHGQTKAEISSPIPDYV
ncbi:hypothetical protein PSTG_02416 [Puccinia striiformis f. sp. tritici PST-78]|uniref:Uncharacterized protein n=1 Tax=Puccinia striiformis f. sp. tritici PST-78 TaxID=1165861 RepID=A0A0L0VZ14_9BASI|nr:hypothetical protein PSTG_02416 [Puccinia striiformis f. sp. tritici PST-78]